MESRRFAEELSRFLEDVGLEGSSWFPTLTDGLDSRTLRKWKTGNDVPNERSWGLLLVGIRKTVINKLDLEKRLAALSKEREVAWQRMVDAQKQGRSPNRAAVTRPNTVLSADSSAHSPLEDTENPEIPTGVEAETAVVLDGLTLNRASELMYDTSATASEREVASSGYVRSLEDFTLGIVFGRIFSGEVREVAPGVRPVDDMRSQIGRASCRERV